MALMGTQLLRMLEARAMGGALEDLTPNARLALFVMALNARDTEAEQDPAHTYFRGWEHLARVALGRATYDDAARQAVRRTVRELTDAGWIKTTGRRHGQRTGLAMYELHM
jgi:hypothetical protein